VDKEKIDVDPSTSQQATEIRSADATDDNNTTNSNYKREMVTLFFYFRCEPTNIIDHMFLAV
jgi:hypothetical protein